MPICYVKNKQYSCKWLSDPESKMLGPTEIWTRIAGFKVQSANHYTMGPLLSKIEIFVFKQNILYFWIFKFLN